jgi:hypothetical protein
MSSAVTVVAIIAAYNEEDVIGQVVRALIEEGVLVYLLDHHSTDKTVAEVERFRGEGVIGIETFPADGVQDGGEDRFSWERILRRKEELAQELEADWFIHHDADEFRESPWSGETLREGIQRVDAAGYNAIDFQVLNFSPTTADPVDGDDIRERLLFYEPGRTWDRVQIKCWKKTLQRVLMTSSGGHSAEFTGRQIFPIRFLLRHYPIRSQAHGECKVLQRRLPRFTPSELARGWHVQYTEFAEGASFVRDPTSLLRYDSEAVRLDLFRRHREVERLERVAAASQDLADRLIDEDAALRRQLQALDAELDWLRSERKRLLSDLDALHTHLAAKETTIANLLASPSWKLTAPLRAADRLFRGSASDSARQPVRPEESLRDVSDPEKQFTDRLFRGSSSGSSQKPVRGDEHLRDVYDREKQFTDRLEEPGRLARENLPLGRALKLASEVDSFWDDGWVGTDLRFRAAVTERTIELRISGLVSPELSEGQDLRLRIDDQEWTYHAGPGSFEWSVPITLEAHTEHQFLISASQSWRPNSSGASNDSRPLAWHVFGIDAC